MAESHDAIIKMLLELPVDERRDLAVKLLQKVEAEYREKRDALRALCGDNAESVVLPSEKLGRQTGETEQKDKKHRKNKSVAQAVFGVLSTKQGKSAFQIAEETGLQPRTVRSPLYAGPLRDLVNKETRGRQVLFTLKPDAKSPFNETPSFMKMLKTVLAKYPEGLTFRELVEHLGHVAESLGNSVVRYSPLSSGVYMLTRGTHDATYDPTTRKYKLKNPSAVVPVRIPTRDEVTMRAHPRHDDIVDVFHKNKNKWTSCAKLASALKMHKSFVADALAMHENEFESRRKPGGREKEYRMKE